MALTKDGEVYCWGRNACGGLGNGKRDNDLYKPQLINFSNQRITDICCEEYHLYALTQSEEVYGWGVELNEHPISKSQLIPTKLIGFNNEKVVQISSGKWHSMALTISGHVYS